MKQHFIDLLEIFRKQTKPQSLSDIKQLCSIPERTLRRRISELVKEGVIYAMGTGKWRKYSLSAPFDVPKIAEEKIGHPFFTEKSHKLLAKVQAPFITREPCSYHEAWLSAYIPNKTFYLKKQVREELYAKGKRLEQEPVAGTYAHKIFNRLLIDLSYNSSRLEGNTYSLLETEKLILEGKPAINKLDLESIMILNHKEAIRFLVDGINRIEMNVDSIRSLHYLLAEDLVPEGQAGQIRDHAVRISATTYVPIEKQSRLKTLLTKIMAKAKQIEDPYEQSFFLLVHLSYLQPFIDVNKRTARLAANISLVRKNLVPLSFNGINKDDYISAMLVIYEMNDILPLAELYQWSYERTCKQYTAEAEAIGIDTLHVLYRSQRRELISKIVLGLICEPKLSKYIESYAKQHVPNEHQQKFIQDTKTQLANLAPFNIAGMGFSKKDLHNWQQHVQQ